VPRRAADFNGRLREITNAITTQTAGALPPPAEHPVTNVHARVSRTGAQVRPEGHASFAPHGDVQARASGSQSADLHWLSVVHDAPGMPGVVA